MKYLGALLAVISFILIATNSNAQQPVCGTLDLPGVGIYDVCPRMPTATPVQPTATLVAPTPTPQPTATATPIVTKPIPSNGVINSSGVYTGTRNCTSTSYCLSIIASNVTLQNFTVTSSAGYGIGVWNVNNVTIKNGFIRAANSSIAFWDTGSNYTVDTVNITATGASSTILIKDGRRPDGICEAYPDKFLHHIKIVNSTINSNVLSQESVYIKCAQDIDIVNNSFSGGSDWHVSSPDSNRINIRDNTFNLLHTSNYLGIEVPKSNDVIISGNTFTGNRTQDHAVGVNSGSQRVTVRNNRATDLSVFVSASGASSGNIFENCLINVGTILTGVGFLVSNNNCITPSTTGDAGLKHER